MIALKNIQRFCDYRICKKFHLQIPAPYNYLIRTVGLDIGVEKRKKMKKRREVKRCFNGTLKKSPLSLRFYLFNKIRKKLKPEEHELAKSI